jgi:hypothetical protein
MLKPTAIVLAAAASSLCATSTPAVREPVVCQTPDAGTAQEPRLPPLEGQCLRTNAYLALGVLNDLSATIDPSVRNEWTVSVPESLQMYVSYGVDGVEIMGPVNTWSDWPFDGTPASSKTMVPNLRLSFGGTAYADPSVEIDPAGYWPARRLYEAMTAAKETTSSEQTTRSSPNGFVTCDRRSTVMETSYTCTITNVVMLDTRLVPCSQGFMQ